MFERGTHPLPFFWKCVKRKGFKSFVLKVCETKGVADAFLRKCVNLRQLTGKMRARGKFPVWCRGSDSRLSMPDLSRYPCTTPGICRAPSFFRLTALDSHTFAKM